MAKSKQLSRLDPWHEQNHRDYRSHWALGTFHLFADQDHELALAEYETAIALNPNQAHLLAMMSLLTVRRQTF